MPEYLISEGCCQCETILDRWSSGCSNCFHGRCSQCEIDAGVVLTPNLGLPCYHPETSSTISSQSDIDSDVEGSDSEQSADTPLSSQSEGSVSNSLENDSNFRRCHIFVWEQYERFTKSYLAILDTYADANFVSYDFVEKLGFNTRGLEPYNGPSVRTEGGPVVPIAQLVLKRGAWATSKQYEHRFLVLDSDTTGVVFGWPTIRELNMFIKNPAFNGMALSTVEKGDYPNGMYELCVLTCAMGLEESRKKEYSDRRKGESKKQSDAMRASLAAQQNSLLTPWSEWILDPASQKFYHHRTNSLGIFETEWYEP